MKRPTAAYVLLALLFLPSCGGSPAGMPEVGSIVTLTMGERGLNFSGKVTGYDGGFLILSDRGTETRLRMSDIMRWK